MAITDTRVRCSVMRHSEGLIGPDAREIPCEIDFRVRTDAGEIFEFTALVEGTVLYPTDERMSFKGRVVTPGSTLTGSISGHIYTAKVQKSFLTVDRVA